MRNKVDKGKFRCCNYVSSIISILPTMLLMLIVIDLFYMVVSTITLPILILSTMFPCGRDIYMFWERNWNRFLQGLFGMSYMDVKGFRCQRTILQLQLESIPQIFFQFYLIWRIRKLHREHQEISLGVDEDAVIISLISAIIHVIFEFVNLYLEALTSDTPVRDYLIACYNAR